LDVSLEILKEIDIDGYDFILLIPNESTELTDKLRTAFSEKLNGRKGLIIDDENTESWLMLYSLYAFTDKLIIGSLDLPNGRKLRNLLECGIATYDELINDVILGAM